MIFSCAMRQPRMGERTNAEIASDAAGALDRCVNLPNDRVKFVVCDRWVTLEGQVAATINAKMPKNQFASSAALSV